MTFEKWWADFSKKYSLDDADSLKSDFRQAWEQAYSVAYSQGFSYRAPTSGPGAAIEWQSE